ncbi:MAG: hypothetical protein HRO68_00485 [Nitrosopumilus sp.]|nr:hypothetical protein [Nitrosopumilus sp.]
MTRTKIIFLVVYTMCRYNTIPLDEERLQSIIQTFLHVQNTPNSLKVISKSLSFLDEAGIPILQKIGFTEFLKNDYKFLLFSKLKSLEEKYPEEVITQMRKCCFELFPKMSDTPQSMKKVIKISMKRCGIC